MSSATSNQAAPVFSALETLRSLTRALGRVLSMARELLHRLDAGMYEYSGPPDWNCFKISHSWNTHDNQLMAVEPNRVAPEQCGATASGELARLHWSPKGMTFTSRDMLHVYELVLEPGTPTKVAIHLREGSVLSAQQVVSLWRDAQSELMRTGCDGIFYLQSVSILSDGRCIGEYRSRHAHFREAASLN